MNCEKAMELMPLYLDQALDNKETKELRLHLLKCKECKNELIQLEEVVSKLQHLPQMELPQGYHSELMEKIQAQAMAQDTPKNKDKKLITSWIGIGATAAVLALVVLAGGGLDKIQQMRDNGAGNSNSKPTLVAQTNAEGAAGGATEDGTDIQKIQAAGEEGAIGFENMEDVPVLDPAETGEGGLPGSVVSSVVASDEEYIIIDDGGLVDSGNVLTAPPEVVSAPMAPLEDALPEDEIITVAIPSEPNVLNEVHLNSAPVIVSQEPIVLTAPENNLEVEEPIAQNIIGAETDGTTDEQAVAWEAIPMEDESLPMTEDTAGMPRSVLTAEGVVVEEGNPVAVEQPMEVVVAAEGNSVAVGQPMEVVAAAEGNSVAVEQPMEVVVAEGVEQPVEVVAAEGNSVAVEPIAQSDDGYVKNTRSTENAVILPQSNVVSFSLSGEKQQELLQSVSDFVESQGGMVMREALYMGQGDSVAPENRILFKIPNAVYDSVIEQLSEMGILGDFMQTQEVMDSVYEVLLQERNILEKNGGYNLEAQLAEYDQRIATWQQEDEYTVVYVTVLE